jgi:acetate kinase
MAEKRKMVSTELFQFTEEGQTLKGIIESIGTQDYMGQVKGRYVISNPEGNYAVTGTAILDDAFKELEKGQMVEIEYLGNRELSGGRTMKRFSVYLVEVEDRKNEK